MPRHEIQTSKFVGSVTMAASAATPCRTSARPPAPDDSSSVFVVTSEVAGERDLQLGERLRGDHHRGDPALHVAGAAAVDVPVSDLGLERVARPLVDRLGRDRVDVAVEEQAPPGSSAGEASDELGPALEAHPRRVERLALELRRVGLEELDLCAGAAQPLPEMLLQAALLAGRIVGRPGRRVEADQRGGELDELALAGRDRGDDLLFQLAQGHARQSRGSPSGRAPDRVHAASPSIGAP